MVEVDFTENATFTYNLIKKVCVEAGPGCPCTPQERARAMIIKNEIEKHVDSVEIEEFCCSPGAFLGWFKIGAIFALISVFFFYLSLNSAAVVLFSFLAFICSLFIFLMFLFEFFLAREFVDFLFPKKGSLNVIGSIKPKHNQEAKRILIFSGHHDSALQFTWLKYLKNGYYIAEGFLIGGVMFLFIGTTVRFIGLLAGVEIIWLIDLLKFLSYAILPITIIIAFFFTGSSKNGGVVPGAVDNLSGAALSVAVGKILKENPDLQPENTEIRIISFGCEEASVRGARAYVKRHYNELKAKDAVCINFESIVNSKITIFKSDRNGTLFFDPSLVQTVNSAADNAQVPHQIKPFPFGGGGTDAIPFAEQGIKSLCLFSLRIPKDMVAFYHQDLDSYDKLNPEALENALKIAIEYCKSF